MKAVELQDLTVKRGIRNILTNINLQVQQGEHTILFGLNGCGKTTLLATLSGYMGYTSGQIRLFGEKMTDENVLELRRQIGFVSNSYFDRCFREENALNIVLSGRYGQLSERYTVQSSDVLRAKHLLKSLGLKEKGRYPYDLLSKGQQQRVLIARALMVPPKLLLLDEPCSGLDVSARQFLLNTIKQIATESDATIICATHYTEEILPCFSKAILMKNGMIYISGEKEKVLTESVLDDFFGEKTKCVWQNGNLLFEIEGNYKIEKSIWQ